jgi:hypothetical protein
MISIRASLTASYIADLAGGNPKRGMEFGPIMISDKPVVSDWLGCAKTDARLGDGHQPCLPRGRLGPDVLALAPQAEILEASVRRILLLDQTIVVMLLQYGVLWNVRINLRQSISPAILPNQR